MSRIYTTKTPSLKATIADIRKLNVKDLTINGEGIIEKINSAKTVVKHASDTREVVTENDLWGTYIETLEDGTVIIHDDILYDTSASNFNPYEVTKVVDNKAFNGTEFYANVQTSKLMDGDFMFYNTDLSQFSSDLSSLVNGAYMFSNCRNLTNFENDLPSLITGEYMFDTCDNLTTFASDLSSLTDGDYMFGYCTNLELFYGDLSSLKSGDGMFACCNKLTTFTSDLSSLTTGQHMFYWCKLPEFTSDLSSLTGGEFMFSSCDNLTTFASDLSSLTDGDYMFGYCTNLESFEGDLSSLTDGNNMFIGCNKLTSFTSNLSSLTDGDYMFSNCKLDASSVSNIIHFLPKQDTTKTIDLGIGVSDSEEARDQFAKECYCDNWDELNGEFSDKNWTVRWRFNGPATMALRGGSTVWTKLEEVFMPTEEQIAEAKKNKEHIRKPSYDYTSQDGTKFYNIRWYHYSNGDNEGFTEFVNLGAAIEAYGVIPKV